MIKEDYQWDRIYTKINLMMLDCIIIMIKINNHNILINQKLIIKLVQVLNYKMM